MAKDGEIGTLTNCPAVDEVFVLAGRSWRVISIDEERKKIYVSQTKSSKIPSWTGTDGDIHTKVVRRMKQVLQESVIYPYLQPNAARLLVQARMLATETGLLESDVLQCGEKSFFIAPWVGTKEIRTIAKMLTEVRRMFLQMVSEQCNDCVHNITFLVESCDVSLKQGMNQVCNLPILSPAVLSL